MSIFPPLQISNGFLERCFTPSSPATLLVGLDHKIFRYGAASALRSSHLQTLPGLIFSGWNFGEAELGWWEIMPHYEWDLFQTLRTPRNFVKMERSGKWLLVSKGCVTELFL